MALRTATMPSNNTNYKDVNSKIWQKKDFCAKYCLFLHSDGISLCQSKNFALCIKKYLICFTRFWFFLLKIPSELKKHASTAGAAVALSPFSELRKEKLLPFWTIKYLELWTIVRFSYARVAILQHNRVSSWIYVYTQNVEIAYRR